MGWHCGEDWGDDYPHRDISEAIIQAAIRVQKALGPGLLENAYKVCLAHRLRLDGHKALCEVHLDITYEGLCVPNAYIMDIVVDDKLVVEVKAIQDFSDANFAQLNSYLHFSSFEVGLLFNFHKWPLMKGGFKRLVNTKA
jgi:GxxExxY protein